MVGEQGGGGLWAKEGAGWRNPNTKWKPTINLPSAAFNFLMCPERGLNQQEQDKLVWIQHICLTTTYSALDPNKSSKQVIVNKLNVKNNRTMVRLTYLLIYMKIAFFYVQSY